MNTLKNTKNSRKEFAVITRLFLKGSRTREFKQYFTYGRGTKERKEMHKMVVEAITVICQYYYENGHPPFEVC
jgi:hypothetical protein